MSLTLALKVLLAATFVVILVGGFLPWSESGAFKENGVDRSNGLAILVLAVAGLVSTVFGRRPRAMLIASSSALLCTLLALIDLADIGSSRNDVGAGIYLTLAGSMAATLAAGALTFFVLKKPETPPPAETTPPPASD